MKTPFILKWYIVFETNTQRYFRPPTITCIQRWEKCEWTDESLTMVAYSCHPLSDDYVDMSDDYVDLLVNYVDLSDDFVHLSKTTYCKLER